MAQGSSYDLVGNLVGVEVRLLENLRDDGGLGESVKKRTAPSSQRRLPRWTRLIEAHLQGELYSHSIGGLYEWDSIGGLAPAQRR